MRVVAMQVKKYNILVLSYSQYFFRKEAKIC